MATWKKVIVSGSNISQLNNDSGYLASAGGGIVSGSAQIAANISGSSTALSSSIASRVTTEANNVDLLQSHQTNLLASTGSIYAHVGNLNSSTGSNYAHIANLNTFTGSAARRTAISGSTTTLSSSLASRVTANEVFSASLDTTFATDAQVLTVSQSLSASLATDIATNKNTAAAIDGEVTNLMAFTGSAARRTAISGSFTALSSSVASDIADITTSFTLAADSGANDTFNSGETLTIAGAGPITTTVSNNQISIDVTDATISGSSTALSSSIAGRVSTEESNVDLLQAHQTNLLAFTGSAARRTAISGAFTATSSSIASDIATLEAATTVLGISGSTGNDSVTVGTDALTFTGAGPITTVVTNNTVTFDVTDALITGSSTALSSSVAGRLTTNEGDIDDLETFSQSFDTAFNLDGANVTVAGNFTVSGTTTNVDSTTIDIGDNIIALNGTGATKGGLAVNDASGPASGSLLWDGTNNYWVAGPTGSEVQIALRDGHGILSSSAQIAANVSGSSRALSSSIASRVTTEENNVDLLQAHQTNLLAFTGSAARRTAVSGAFTATSASIASDIADIETSFTLAADSGANDSFSSGQTLTFAGSGPITTTVSNNQIAIDVTDAIISGSSTALSSSIAGRVTTNTTNITALDGEVTNLMAATGSQFAHIGNLNTKTGSLDTEITALENFSSSLSSTVISYTGSFAGDGSSLTGITVSQNATAESTFTSATTSSVTHNFGTKNVIVSVYDDKDEQIIPSTVRLTSTNAVEVHLGSSTSGKVVVAKGGHIVSGSIPFANLSGTPALLSGSAQIAANISGSFTSTSASIASDIADISTSFTLAADSGANDSFSSGQTLTFAGAGPITTTVSNNQISIDVTDAIISGSSTALSSSVASDIADLPTLAEVNTITSSLSSSLATSIATKAVKTAVSGAFTATSASIASDIADISTSFTLAADSGANDSFSSGQTLTFAGTSNEIETTVSNNQIQIGLPNNVTIGNNLTVTGDLTVTGNTVEQQVTNLNVEDQFILLNSGSSAQDSGIVINGQGAAFGWDESENRWGLDFSGATFNQTSLSSDAFVAAVVTSDDANYQKVGNIRIDGDDIYIYS